VTAPRVERHADLTDGATVREQLERLLASSHFHNSKRFPSLLRFVVEHVLKGQSDLLKERTLGIEVFGRSANYDTSADPIVRVTAAEVRKRIAQYYDEPGRERELRIALPSGSYVPQFYWPDEIEVDRTLVHPVDGGREGVTREKPGRAIWMALAALFIFAAGIAFGVFWNTPWHPGFDYFWGPVLQSRDSVLFCVADQNQYSTITLRDANDPSRQTILKDNLTAVLIDDLSPALRVAGLLQAKGKPYSLRAVDSTSLSDLRNVTAVVIGAFDNAWTLRLTRQLRYHFDNDALMSQFRIVDSGLPAHAPWVVNRPQQMSTNNYKDYAIVARFTDPTTGKLTIVVAGIARGGTVAAGEFLTNPNNLEQLRQAAHAGGDKSNLEIVLSTEIIDGNPGVPRMEASYFW
jgi:hypothetical protein